MAAIILQSPQLPLSFIIDRQSLSVMKTTIEPQCEKMYLLPCAHNEDSNQPAHSRSLIRVLVVRMKKVCNLGNPKCDHKDSEQIALMRRLILIFTERTSPKVRFLMLRLNLLDAFSYIINLEVFRIIYLDNARSKHQ